MPDRDKLDISPIPIDPEVAHYLSTSSSLFRKQLTQQSLAQSERLAELRQAAADHQYLQQQYTEKALSAFQQLKQQHLGYLTSVDEFAQIVYTFVNLPGRHPVVQALIEKEAAQVIADYRARSGALLAASSKRVYEQAAAPLPLPKPPVREVIVEREAAPPDNSKRDEAYLEEMLIWGTVLFILGGVAVYGMLLQASIGDPGRWIAAAGCAAFICWMVFAKPTK